MTVPPPISTRPTTGVLVLDAAWWPPADVRTATEPVVLDGLADLLEALAADRTSVGAAAVDRVVGKASA